MNPNPFSGMSFAMVPSNMFQVVIVGDQLANQNANVVVARLKRGGELTQKLIVLLRNITSKNPGPNALGGAPSECTALNGLLRKRLRP